MDSKNFIINISALVRNPYYTVCYSNKELDFSNNAQPYTHRCLFSREIPQCSMIGFDNKERRIEAERIVEGEITIINENPW